METSVYPYLKRLFDILFSVGILLVSAPFLLLLALLIKCSSKGPIFYKSLRIGKSGHPIYCWKFRTMYIDAEKKLHLLLQEDLSMKKEWETYQKLKTDPRIYPLGRFLRKFSLDEFPQFWNVLRGDLSVVGPRPFYEEQIHTYLGEKAGKFLSIKPGITGLWQISGRNLLSFEERLKLEEHYIDAKSFFLDLKIILKTFPAIFSAKGAY